MTVTRIFVEGTLEGRRSLVLTGAQRKYLCTVLRIRPGEQVLAFDGSGLEYIARFDSADRKRARLVILGTNPALATESPLRLVLAQALLKAEKMDWVVQKAGELGVTEICPFTSARAVPSVLARRAQARLDRWARIAREASRQCGRTRSMEVGRVVAFEEILSRGSSFDRAFVCSSRGGETLERLTSGEAPPRSVLVAVGPEGGLTDEEVSLAVARGFVRLSLGPRVLRAETAAIIAVGLVQHRFGDLL
jgi:16S rRNA (uracil1498-N3)-methyltransferase